MTGDRGERDEIEDPDATRGRPSGFRGISEDISQQPADSEPSDSAQARRPTGATRAGRRSSGSRWLLIGLFLLLIPVGAASYLQVTRSTDAGRISSPPPAVIFAKPVDAAVLPDAVGEYALQRPENAPPLPHGILDSAFFVRPDGQALRVVVQESRVTSLAEYERSSGLTEAARIDLASCGRMDEQAQCVSLLRGGLVVAIAVDPALDPQEVAAFVNDAYAALPEG